MPARDGRLMRWIVGSCTYKEGEGYNTIDGKRDGLGEVTS